MDQAMRQALEASVGPAGHCTVDITTYGAKTGLARRLEIWLYRADGVWYLSGRPAPRGWYANLLADPRLIVHVKHGAQADLTATARPITDPAERRPILARIIEQLDRAGTAADGTPRGLDEWVAGSPLAEVLFDDGVSDAAEADPDEIVAGL